MNRRRASVWQVRAEPFWQREIFIFCLLFFSSFLSGEENRYWNNCGGGGSKLQVNLPHNKIDTATWFGAFLYEQNCSVIAALTSCTAQQTKGPFLQEVHLESRCLRMSYPSPNNQCEMTQSWKNSTVGSRAGTKKPNFQRIFFSLFLFRWGFCARTIAWGGLMMKKIWCTK